MRLQCPKPAYRDDEWLWSQTDWRRWTDKCADLLYTRQLIGENHEISWDCIKGCKNNGRYVRTARNGTIIYASSVPFGSAGTRRRRADATLRSARPLGKATTKLPTSVQSATRTANNPALDRRGGAKPPRELSRPMSRREEIFRNYVGAKTRPCSSNHL